MTVRGKNLYGVSRGQVWRSLDPRRFRAEFLVLSVTPRRAVMCRVLGKEIRGRIRKVSLLEFAPDLKRYALVEHGFRCG